MKSKLFSFFKGKKVLITGNTGFKGTWLALTLSKMGAELYGLSRDNNPSNTFATLTLNSIKIQQLYGEIACKETVQKAISEIKPDIIFHLAAQPLVSKSYQDPFETMNTNINGALAVLEALRIYEQKCCFVLITSDKCYDLSLKKDTYSEDDILGGKDPYSLSKAMQEQLFKLYHYNYFSKKENISCCSIRSGNVIGGGDFSSTRLIPDMFNHILNKESIILRNPSAVRPWIFIMDTIHAYLLAAMKTSQSPQLNGQSYNVGPEKTGISTVKNLVELFLKHYPNSSETQVLVQEEVNFEESNYLFLSTNKIRTTLNWKENLTVERAMIDTANWYATFQHNPNTIVTYTQDYISSFLSEALQEPLK